MYKEFFVRDFLRKRIGLYLISHEIVFIPLYIFFYSAFQNSIWLPNDLSRLSHLLFLIFPVIIIEFGRKIKQRKNHNGELTDDTYAYVWGEENSLRIFILLIFLEGILSINLNGINYHVSIVIIAASVVLFILSFVFPRILIRNNMLLTTFFALSIPASLLV